MRDEREGGIDGEWHSQAVIILLVLVTKDSEAVIDMLKEKECVCLWSQTCVCVCMHEHVCM